MTLTLIIFGIFMIAAFYGGFFFGYLKREGKPPESIPIISDVVNAIDKAMEGTKKQEKPSKEELKANNFFN
jgi:hypothetical protein